MQVIWTRVSDGNPLTVGTSVYTYDERISIQHSRKNDWNLLIRNVKLYDAGKYVCQVNGKGIFATGTVLLKVNGKKNKLIYILWVPQATNSDVL